MIHDPVRVALVLLIVAAASALKGVIGFGFPLVAVPLVATILGPRVAVPLVAFPSLLSNVILMSRGGAGRAIGSLVVLLAGIVIGTIAGARVITMLDPRPLSVLVGGITLAYVLATASRLTEVILPSAGRRAAPAVGLLAGFMGGATGIFAPLLAGYLHLLELPKREFVFWITVLFFVGNIVQVGSYLRLGLYPGPVMVLSLLACVPMAVGTWAGIVLQDRLAPGAFSRVVLVVVFLASLNLLVRGALG